MSSEIEGLTKKRRKALKWLRDNGPTSMFPRGVNLRLLRNMVAEGLVREDARIECGFPLQVVVLAITDAGRAALSAKDAPTSTEDEEYADLLAALQASGTVHASRNGNGIRMSICDKAASAIKRLISERDEAREALAALEG